MKKLLFCALIIQTCTLSHAMDIIEIPNLDARHDPEVIVQVELVKLLEATALSHQKALNRIQEILQQISPERQQYKQSLVQQPAGQIKKNRNGIKAL